MIARTLGRLAPEPLLVRLGVLAAGLAAAALATPAGLPPLALVAVAVAAVLPAVRPGGPWATLAIVAALAGWFGQPGGPVQLLLLGGALYLLHTLAALATTLPYDAAVAPEVLTRWLVRSLGVLLVSSVLAAGVLAALAWLPAAGGYVPATLAGLVLAGLLLRTLSPTPRSWSNQP